MTTSGSTSTVTPRELWAGGPVAPALGLGTWALGGPSSAGDQPLGWGSGYDVDEAVEVVRAAFDAGITLFDTADAYGAGGAERVVGRALAGHRDEVTLVSKWGNTIDEAAGQLTGQDPSASYVRTALEATLRRLGTDHLDLYLLHLSGLPAAQAADLLEGLQDLVSAGTIGGYGWSTDDPALAAAWVGQPGFRALEFEVNVVRDAPDLIAVAEAAGLTALARGPLGTGLLTGAHPAGSRITDEADFRYRSPDWLHYFRDGRPDPELLARLDAVTQVLTSGGRSLVHGALGWVWARSPHLIPIPGARTVAQAVHNAAALAHGPLTPAQVAEVDRVLTSSPA